MSIYDYFVQLRRYLLWQTNKVRTLERRLSVLEARLRELESQPRTTIERIEYKFDQLKVETLEGTLNIGIAPPGAGGTIEDFAVEPVKTVVPKPEPVLMRPIQEKVAAYLNSEAAETLKRLEQQYNRRLDDTYRQFILQDIARQTDERIRFYLQEKANQGYVPAGDRDETVENEIFQKVKADIEQSLDAFLKHLPSGEEST
ncbi:spore germination protein GerPC [Geobacillus sp. FSL K6-0789]|jgi:spore germination protein PC|uniref:Protein GerPC required for proper assembly of spore coat mutations lead to super-dormant spore n=1 Tax=Geobacillus stearothermophilus TaxID=1422 RepID=A0A087LBJ4_GEOSE|nr:MULTISPECIES: spore germination protein GerPC [Geobacillus]AKM17966.1 putative spore germination protein GerPC [Geobacillus sp. 12AMOR1]AKU27280.1 spore gernimation protein GerPC [Geobacillus sp. LC300]ASS87967.1 spore gernimation protein GerPC [Geobacillus lituanicus]MED0653434.1 spore germination protein GerPC [Anoxybacillus geothermalis]STO36358.1 Probable spore germination protein gerPC [[Flavobacterium] thermophilum]